MKAIADIRDSDFISQFTVYLFVCLPLSSLFLFPSINFVSSCVFLPVKFSFLLSLFFLFQLYIVFLLVSQFLSSSCPFLLVCLVCQCPSLSHPFTPVSWYSLRCFFLPSFCVCLFLLCYLSSFRCGCLCFPFLSTPFRSFLPSCLLFACLSSRLPVTHRSGVHCIDVMLLPSFNCSTSCHMNIY